MIRQTACFLLLLVLPASAADRSLSQNPELARYFDDEVSQIEQQKSLLQYTSLEQWEADRPTLRAQLFDMLGLRPLPARTTLNATITGVIDETEFRVEKLHFQSMPGLYVTANFYLPEKIDAPCRRCCTSAATGEPKKETSVLATKHRTTIMVSGSLATATPA